MTAATPSTQTTPSQARRLETRRDRDARMGTAPPRAPWARHRALLTAQMLLSGKTCRQCSSAILRWQAPGQRRAAGRGSCIRAGHPAERAGRGASIAVCERWSCCACMTGSRHAATLSALCPRCTCVWGSLRAACIGVPVRRVAHGARPDGADACDRRSLRTSTRSLLHIAPSGRTVRGSRRQSALSHAALPPRVCYPLPGGGDSRRGATMTGAFDAATLAMLAESDESAIVVPRATGRAPAVPIWVVVDGGAVYVRSVRGEQGRWYRALRAHPDAAIQVAGRHLPVRAEPVADAETIARVDEAYRAKYGGSPYLPPLFNEDARRCTVRLVPR